MAQRKKKRRQSLPRLLAGSGLPPADAVLESRSAPLSLGSYGEPDRDARVRAIFQLTARDPWPERTRENLQRYHLHLAKHLLLPMQVWLIDEEGGEGSPAIVTGLAVVEEGDGDRGLRCEVILDGEPDFVPLLEIAVRSLGPNRELIEDYRAWFGPVAAATRSNDADEESMEAAAESELSIGRALLALIVVAGGRGAAYGAVLEVGLAAESAAFTTMKTGALLLALVGAVMGAQGRALYAIFEPGRRASLLGMLAKTLSGAAMGALAGMMVSIWPGAYVGGLVGLLVGRLSDGHYRAIRTTIIWAAVTAGCGVLIQAWRQDSANFWSPLLRGAGWGALAGPLFLLMILTLEYFQQAHDSVD